MVTLVTTVTFYIYVCCYVGLPFPRSLHTFTLHVYYGCCWLGYGYTFAVYTFTLFVTVVTFPLLRLLRLLYFVAFGYVDSHYVGWIASHSYPHATRCLTLFTFVYAFVVVTLFFPLPFTVTFCVVTYTVVICCWTCSLIYVRYADLQLHLRYVRCVVWLLRLVGFYVAAHTGCYVTLRCRWLLVTLFVDSRYTFYRTLCGWFDLPRLTHALPHYVAFFTFAVGLRLVVTHYTRSRCYGFYARCAFDALC